MGNFVSYENAETLMQGVANRIAELDGAYILRGSVTFANLPAVLTKTMVGYVYNVKDDFETTSNFLEGAGKKYSGGTNVVVADASTYSLVTPVGSEDPSNEGWYVLDNDDYVLTEDTTVESGTDYYAFVESFVFDVNSTFVDVAGIYDAIDDVASMIADEFDKTQAYAIGDVVFYERGLYRFKAAHTANDDWDVAEVDATTVEELIADAEPDSLTVAQVNALLALLD